MGKKKRQTQNSINGPTDTSESESSKDSGQVAEGTKAACAHLNKALDLPVIRKASRNIRDKYSLTFCNICSKTNSPNVCKDGWVCLRCGLLSCGPEEANHRLDHFKTPHSSSHSLAFQLKTNVIWCFQCERELPVNTNKKVQSCIDMIRKVYDSAPPGQPSAVLPEMDKTNSSDPTPSEQPLQNGCISKDIRKAELNLPKVRGLVNLGNTCFFNSVLQCLAQTPGLVSLLKEMDVPGERFHLELEGHVIDAVLEKHKTMALSEPLALVLMDVSGVTPLTTEDKSNGRYFQYTVNPRRLLSALTSSCRQFEGGDQHDAHELLRHLLDTVHTEDLRRYQKAILDHIGFNKRMDEVEEDKKAFGKKLNQKVCDTIPIRPDQIFKGSLVSILECDVCHHVSKREETFLDLSLPVAQEKPQPPSVRRKYNCSSPVEEKQSTEVTVSKYQLKKDKKNARRARKTHYSNGTKTDNNQGEPTIEEEDKKDSIDGDQSDADVEDNACEEQDNKTEVVESGYSSEKQMSVRGSPVTVQSAEDETKPVKPNDLLSDVNVPVGDPETVSANRAESGLGSIQELTVAIPEEVNIECTSQESVRVNASNGSVDVSSDSPQGNFKMVDLSLPENQLPPSSDSLMDRNTMIYNWECTGKVQFHGQERESVSPGLGSPCSQDNIVSPKGSPVSEAHSNDMSVCTSLQNSNENMSVCTSLPENVSLLLNSPAKSQCSPREDNSGLEERPESRMECHKNRSSPVEAGEGTELNSGLLRLSLQGMTCAGDADCTEEVNKPLSNTDAQSGFVLVGGVTADKTSVPQPPALPLYSYTHPEPVESRHDRYKTEEGECSLQSCLTQFTMVEMLTGGNKVSCDGCTERLNKGNKEGKTVYQNSTKQLLIHKLPPIMIFHLKRFQVQRCSFRKLGRHVEFPLVLDISPFCSLSEKNKKNEGPVLYSLYGVVEHSGTLHGGHYVACVKVRSHADQQPGVPPPGKWYFISDSFVRDIDEHSVLQKQAYLLFYERIL